MSNRTAIVAPINWEEVDYSDPLDDLVYLAKSSEYSEVCISIWALDLLTHSAKTKMVLGKSISRVSIGKALKKLNKYFSALLSRNKLKHDVRFVLLDDSDSTLPSKEHVVSGHHTLQVANVPRVTNYD